MGNSTEKILANHVKLRNPRMWYYLLDWKDRNMDWFLSKYNHRALMELTDAECVEIFKYATEQDIKNTLI